MKLIKELQEQAVLNEMTDVVKFSKKDLEALKKMDDSSNLSDEMTEKMQEFVWDYDPSWMPYGTAKARTGDPYVWIADNFDKIVAAIEKHAHLT